MNANPDDTMTPVTSAFRRHSAGWAVACLVVTLTGTAAAVAVLGLTREAPGEIRAGLVEMVFALLPYGLAGWVLIDRRPDLPFGWLLGGTAVALALEVVTVGPAWIALARGHHHPLLVLGLTTSSLGFLSIGVQGIVNVRFPSGRPSTRPGRWLDRMLIWGLVLVVGGGFFRAIPAGDLLPDGVPADLQNPLAVTALRQVAQATEVLAPALVLLGLIAGLGVVARWRRATGVERQQLAWRAAGVLVALALFPLAITERLGSVVTYLDPTVFVATLAIPVLRYRLWAIDTIVRRSAVYGGVTAVLVATYVALTAAVAGLASQRVTASVAAAGVALALLPARAVSQRLVDRLFYGQRADPYQALSDIGRRLETVAAPGEVLHAVIVGVAQSLRLPYVAIEGPDEGMVIAAAGERPRRGMQRWPLVYQGHPVGALAAAPRRGEDAFDERDRAVLAAVARQAGPAVRAEALTADLLESRQRLVTAREEDRRRLRRDLHDGLGPMLTGLGLTLDAARSRLAAAPGDPATREADIAAMATQLKQVDELLARAKEASSQVITDLRGMVYELRPPALDELGLVDAVRLHGERLAAGGGLTVEVQSGDLPVLPAAVEVAAFRAAVEAITNVVRHSPARRSTVRLAATSHELVLEVRDDGPSRATADTPWRPGVGLTAMRERAEELGGTFLAEPGPDGGHVVARYPLPGTGAVRAPDEPSGEEAARRVPQ